MINKRLLPIMVALILIILSFFYLVAYKQEEVDNWEVYKNSELGYEIQYPSGWHIKEFKRSMYPEAGPFPSFHFQNKEKVDLIVGYPSGSVFEIVLHQASDFNPPARNMEVLDINGLMAKCYLSSNYGPVFDCWIWANRDDYFFRLAGYVTDQKERVQNSQTLEEMLSSFKIK